MKQAYLAISFYLLSSTVLAEQIFTEKHLGIQFHYEKPISIDFNPHAMRKIPIYLNSKYVGGFVASASPEGLTEEKLIKYGLKRYQSEYGADNVLLTVEKNMHNLEYYYYVVTNTEFTIEKAIFFKTRNSNIKKEGIKTTYTFNYKYKNREHAEYLRKIIDSFNLIPNESHYNDALSRAVNK